jgi:orotate phosphoribosyltransferase
MLTEAQKALATMLPQLQILDWTRTFTLKSGKRSPYYADWRRLRGSVEATSLAIEAGLESMFDYLINDEAIDCVGDIPTGVTPFVANLCHKMGYPQVSPHPAKDHGKSSTIDGIYRKGEQVCLWDDVATSGGSMIDGIKILTEAGLVVLPDVFVIMDREQGAEAALLKNGYRLHSILTLTEVMEYYHEENMITDEKYEEIMDYVKNDTK